MGHEALAQGSWGSDAGAVEHDHGDERFGVVEAAGVGAEAADRGVPWAGISTTSSTATLTTTSCGATRKISPIQVIGRRTTVIDRWRVQPVIATAAV